MTWPWPNPKCLPISGLNRFIAILAGILGQGQVFGSRSDQYEASSILIFRTLLTLGYAEDCAKSYEVLKMYLVNWPNKIYCTLKWTYKNEYNFLKDRIQNKNDRQKNALFDCPLKLIFHVAVNWLLLLLMIVQICRVKMMTACIEGN